VAQVKIYGVKENLSVTKVQLSETIHECIVDVLAFPQDKKFHRFIALDRADFIFPDDKSDEYIIIEIMMMQGRSAEVKKALIHALFNNIVQVLKITSNDIEICIVESPTCNWGFRGETGDEIQLNYTVKV